MGPIFRNNWLKCFHTDFFPNKENDKESYARPVVSTRVSTRVSTGVSTGVSTCVSTGVNTASLSKHWDSVRQNSNELSFTIIFNFFVTAWTRDLDRSRNIFFYFISF